MQSGQNSSAKTLWRAPCARLLLVAVLAAPLGACGNTSLGTLFGAEEVVPDQPPRRERERKEPGGPKARPAQAGSRFTQAKSEARHAPR